MKKIFLCTLIEMYDGREFIHDEFLLITDKEIGETLNKRVENIPSDSEEDEWRWEGKWWTNDGESVYTTGSIREISEKDYLVLSKYIRVETEIEKEIKVSSLRDYNVLTIVDIPHKNLLDETLILLKREADYVDCDESLNEFIFPGSAFQNIIDVYEEAPDYIHSEYTVDQLKHFAKIFKDVELIRITYS
jgi:hypothetical protein